MGNRLGAVACATTIAITGWATVADAGAQAQSSPTAACGSFLYAYNPTLRYAASDRVSFAPTSGGTAAAEDPLRDGLKEVITNVKREPRVLNILVLSGGGQWGAYGAGFLQGWAEATLLPGEVRRQDIDIITGVSTGAMQTTFAYLGSMDGDDEASRNRRESANKSLSDAYTNSQQIEGLIQKRNPWEYLWSGSLYTVDKLVTSVSNGIESAFDDYRNMPARQRVYVGLVNLDRNEFFVADMKAIARSKVADSKEDQEVSKAVAKAREDAKKPKEDTHRANKSCMARVILGSAAVPLAFPPRMINGDMLADGGTRIGLFATILLTRPDIVEELRKGKIKPSFHVVINGNLNANSYGSKPREKTEEKLIDIGKAALRNVLDQLYKDAAYRNEQDLRSVFGEKGYFSRYTYIHNKEITDSPEKECASSVKRQQADEPFDPEFMNCLFKLGRAKGKRQQWEPFEALPAVPTDM